MEFMVYFIPVIGVLVCWLCAENMLVKDRLNKLEVRLEQLETTSSHDE